jgi:ketosteroid isomerase-like protein
MPAMKKVFLSSMILLVLLGCAAKGDNINTNNIPVVENYLRAIQDKNVDRLGLLLSDDFRGYGPSVNDSTDKAGAVDKWKQLFAAYDAIEFVQPVCASGRVDSGSYSGDYVTCWTKVKIATKNGKAINVPMHSAFRIAGGKINLARLLFNEADSMRQLGYRFEAPAQ